MSFLLQLESACVQLLPSIIPFSPAPIPNSHFPSAGSSNQRLAVDIGYAV